MTPGARSPAEGSSKRGTGTGVSPLTPRGQPLRMRLLVDPRLEDVAGNSVRRVFDRDLDLPDHDPTPGGTVVIRLTSRA